MLLIILYILFYLILFGLTVLAMVWAFLTSPFVMGILSILIVGVGTGVYVMLKEEKQKKQELKDNPELRKQAEEKQRLADEKWARHVGKKEN